MSGRGKGRKKTGKASHTSSSSLLTSGPTKRRRQGDQVRQQEASLTSTDNGGHLDGEARETMSVPLCATVSEAAGPVTATPSWAHKVPPAYSRGRQGGDTSTGAYMEHIGLEASRLIDAALSVSTKRAYQGALRSFVAFRHQFNLRNDWPIPLEHLLNYMAFLSLRGLAHSTLSLHLSALSYQHKICGLYDTTASFIVRKLLEGTKRLRKHFDVRAPITYNVLSKMCYALNQICPSSYESLLFQAAYSLTFFGFMRVGEVVFTDHVHRDRPLKITDIALHDNSIKVTIRSSKTDQLAQGCTLHIQRCAGPVCPVVIMKKYLSVRPCGSPYLFCHMNLMPLTSYQFSALVSKTIAFIGLDPSIYKSHSFRIGAATTAADMGISSETIQYWGRWKSGCYATYIRIH